MKKYRSKESAFQALLKNAHEHHTVESLCEAIGLELRTYYSWTKDRKDIQEQVLSKLAKRFTMYKQQTEGGELVTVTITYKEAQRARINQYNDEERQRLTDLICYAYELGVSVRESCNKLGVHTSTFYKWINPDSPISYVYAVERFKLAKKTFQSEYNEELAFTARTRLYEKLNERKVTNTTLNYETRGKSGEDFVLVGKKIEEKTFQPEISAISLVLNNLDPDFRKATAGGQIIEDDEALRRMDEDELRSLLDEEIQKGKLLRGENNEANTAK